MRLADILIWPSVGTSDFVWLIGFIIFMVVSFFIVNLLFRKQKTLQSSSGFVSSETIIKDFSPEETKVLKKFINNLENEKKEFLSTTKNWKFLRKDLYDYLLKAGVGAEISVRIYDRLFLQSKVEHSFNLSDIQQGELVALITEFGEELTRIAKATEEDILLSSSKTLIPPMARDLDSKIYIFRPREGGYYIKGKIVGTMNEAVLFHIEGKPEHAGHAHLMIQEKFQVEISNWPKVDENSILEEENRQKLNEIIKNEDSIIEEELNSLELEIRRRFGKEKSDPNSRNKNLDKQDKEIASVQKQRSPIKNIEFFCLAVKLSDRGLLLELPEGVSPEFWRESEIWELKFQMPSGRNIVTKAKIFPSSGSRIRYISKFIDMEESLRILIYEEIKAFGGNREVLI